MRRLISLSLFAALGTAPACSFAVKHPAATAGVVAGTLALGTCELASEEHGSCLITSGAVGVGLAIVAGVALWLGSEDAPASATDGAPPAKVDWEKIPDTTPAQPTTAPPDATPAPTTPAPTTPAPAPPAPTTPAPTTP